MIHTSITQNCTVFLLRRELTRSAIYASQQFDAHKWPIVLVDEVKIKPRNFEAHLCRSFILLLQHLSNRMHFITNGYRTLFKDQLGRPKATCSFETSAVRKFGTHTGELHKQNLNSVFEKGEKW